MADFTTSSKSFDPQRPTGQLPDKTEPGKEVISAKRKVLILFVIPALLYVGLLSVMPLVERDETRYSAIPSLMNETGDYITPRLDHVVFLDKPPLCYWFTALFFKIFGENEFSSRLFVALCAWGCILLVYFMGSHVEDEKTGLYSAGVLTTFLFSFFLGRYNLLDIPLTFFLCLATWAGYRYFAIGGSGDVLYAADGQDEMAVRSRGQSKKWLYLLYLSAALAFLVKGLIGVAFPFAILFLWLSVSSRWRDIPRLFSPVGIALFLAVTLPWIILVQMANDHFLWFFFIREHFLRYTTNMHGREGIFLYYIPVVLLGTLPWTAFYVDAVRCLREKRTAFFGAENNRFLIVWALFIFLFFSLSSSKLIPYIAPVFLPIAVFSGHLFRLCEERLVNAGGARAGGWPGLWPVVLQSALLMAAVLAPLFIPLRGIAPKEWLPFVLLPALLLALMVILPRAAIRRWNGEWFLTVYILAALFWGSMVFPASHLLTPWKTSYPVVQAVRTVLPPGEDLYQYDGVLYGIEFYLKIRTPLVDDFVDLTPGIAYLPPEERARYFLSSREFFDLCRKRKVVYCVTEGPIRLDRLRKELNDVDVLWENGTYYLLRLRA
jgi:4-amino-4-deoxy-L-arabinose transferase-like glycosyltransferase